MKRLLKSIQKHRPPQQPVSQFRTTTNNNVSSHQHKAASHSKSAVRIDPNNNNNNNHLDEDDEDVLYPTTNRELYDPNTASPEHENDPEMNHVSLPQLPDTTTTNNVVAEMELYYNNNNNSDTKSTTTTIMKKNKMHPYPPTTKSISSLQQQQHPHRHYPTTGSSSTTATTSTDETRNLVKQFIADIWNRGALDMIPMICSPSIRFNGNTGFDRVGHDGLARMVLTIRNALEEYHCEIHSMVVEQNKAFCRLRFTGKQVGYLLGIPPTYQHVAWMGATEFTIQQQKIFKVWELGDVKSLEEQLLSHSTTNTTTTTSTPAMAEECHPSVEDSKNSTRNSSNNGKNGGTTTTTNHVVPSRQQYNEEDEMTEVE